MRPIVFSRPRHTTRALEWLWVQIILSMLAGVIVAALTHQSTKKFSFWSLTLASGATVFFIGYFLVNRLLISRPRSDTIRSESAGLTTSIMSSLKSAYAVSSNWLDLWRTPSFAYYLHLDATTSLVGYSGLLDSPLGRLSANPADQQDFFDYGCALVNRIAANDAPISPHRLRLLIYPRWVYEVYADAITQLIKSHSAGRIPCLPLVAEELDQRLSDKEKADLLALAAVLHQNVLDKMPPRAPLIRAIVSTGVRYEKTRQRLGPVFPDILLIDADLPSDTARAWWYSRDGSIANWSRQDEGLSLVNTVVRSICAHANGSRWSEYTASTLGHVVVTPPLQRLESEAFFGHAYYQEWLDWIREHSKYGKVDAAREIADWLSAEDAALMSFVDNLQPTPESRLRLLDVGCGFGRHLLKVTKAHSVDAVGIDINERMIAGALDAAHGRSHAQGHVSFVVGDGAFMGQLQPHSFDAAICMTNTLGNMPPDKQRAMLQRLGVVLRPGGRVLLSVYGEGSTQVRRSSYTAIGLRVEEKGTRILAAEGLSSECFSRHTLSHLLTDNGLEVERIDPLGSIGLIATAAVGSSPQP